jgi:hypothetical protein
LSRVLPPEDVDLILVLRNPGIRDCLHLPGTPYQVWLLSEAAINNETSHVIVLDLAMNLLNGLALRGHVPIAAPPVIERLKLAAFYANLICRIYFDCTFEKLFKRMVELKAILHHFGTPALSHDAGTVGAGSVSWRDRLVLHELAEIAAPRWDGLRFSAEEAWEDFDRLLSWGCERDIRLEKQRMVELACGYKELLRLLILDIQAAYLAHGCPVQGPVQEPRIWIYALMNARNPECALELQLESARRFPDDLSIALHLATSSRHPEVLQVVIDNLERGRLRRFDAGAIIDALGENPAAPVALRRNIHEAALS